MADEQNANVYKPHRSKEVVEDMFERVITHYELSVPFKREIEYSSQLEDFIRQIVREEIAKALGIEE